PKEQFVLYERGRKAFPEFFNLHFAMISYLRPEWYGSNAEIAAFIAAVVQRSPESSQAELYTRLWWFAGGEVSEDVDIFRDMGASWPRMKEGFESLVKSRPDSAWNRSVYAAYACHAHDMTTFTGLRIGLAEKIDPTAFPSKLSLDVCDARANGKPI